MEKSGKLCYTYPCVLQQEVREKENINAVGIFKLDMDRYCRFFMRICGIEMFFSSEICR